MNPFDFVNAINSSKKTNLIQKSEDPDLAEKQYVPYLVNKALSYFPDTVMYANAMNFHGQLDNKLQFDYLLNSTRPAKRVAKWVKVEDNDDLELVKQYYGYNNKRAKEVLPLLSEKQISFIKQQLQEGGIEDDNSR